MDFMQFIQSIINEKMTLNSLSKNIGSTLGDINIKDFNLMLKRPYSKSKLHDNFINLHAYIESHIEDDIINAYKEGVYNKTLRIREDVVKENFKKYNKDEEYNNVHGYSTFIGFILSEIEEGDYLNAGRRILQYMIWVYGEEIIKKKLIQLTKDYLNGVIDSDDEEYDEGFDESLSRNNHLRENEEEEPYFYTLEIGDIEVNSSLQSLKEKEIKDDYIEVYFDSTIVPKEYPCKFRGEDSSITYNSTRIPNILINGDLSAIIRIPFTHLPEEVETKAKEFIKISTEDDKFEHIKEWDATLTELNSLLRSCDYIKKYIDDSLFFIRNTLPVSTDTLTLGEDYADLNAKFKVVYMMKKFVEYSHPIEFVQGVFANIEVTNSKAILAMNNIIKEEITRDTSVDSDDEEYDEGFEESLIKHKRRLRY